ncbi:MAG: MarC family protein [Alphaproteobacteria bacterium]
MDWTTITTSFVTLFVVIDPLGVTPVFAALTRGMGWGRRIRTALAATLIAALILGGFALGGGALLETLGIGLPAFRTAGGILLFLIGLEMIFEQRTPRRERNVQRKIAEQHEVEEEDGIAVFPLAIPLLAGPGAIASIVLLMTAAEGDDVTRTSILAALALVIAASFVLLVTAGFLLALAGRSVSILITRLMGVLLAALSVQFVFDGIREGILLPAATG